MMGTLRCDHPDIEAFIAAKRDPKRLRMFNLSVLASDAFMTAVKNDGDGPWFSPERSTAPSAPANCGTRSCGRPMRSPSPG